MKLNTVIFCGLALFQDYFFPSEMFLVDKKELRNESYCIKA